MREILVALCQSDVRYTWSVDAASINVYPRAIFKDPSYLLNLQIDQIVLEDITDPDQALTQLSEQIPAQQIGYMQLGGDNPYSRPCW